MTDDTRSRAIDIYSRLADRASTGGLRLGLEALNRYESNFINTIREAELRTPPDSSPNMTPMRIEGARGETQAIFTTWRE